ncbi:MAG: transglutaminase domain-containing protein [Betaproteobacteria bacterium]|nr:transglutaminase domain-containing protein [Betaproteobacteria bacterium]
MKTDRRAFFCTGAAFAALALTTPRLAAAAMGAGSLPRQGWRSFELRTRVEVLKADGVTQVWLPVPAIDDAAWTRVLGNTWEGNAAQAQLVSEPVYGAKMLHAQCSAGTQAPVIELVSQVATRDRAIDFAAGAKPASLDAIERALYTRATRLIPTDGIVRETALGIVKGASTDLDKARRIYDWICDNTFRDPKVLGCGIGDIRSMLVTRNLSGKCADLNALYVGLARAVGLPARDVYGIRVADSRFGYKSLGKSGDVSKAQHCRAEVWLADFGWVPVDPADVRKVVLEEKPGLTMNDPLVVEARKKLFGGWEMNWLAFNFAHDINLPGARGSELPFLMYPQAESAGGRRDSLDPANFSYRITAKEITAA